MEKKLAPICLFVYNRLEETKATVEALKVNDLAQESHLYIYSDSWRNSESENNVMEIRNYIKTIVGFKKITIVEATENLGLANSIINGVTIVIEKYGKVIVLEDDLITSNNFLVFMNQALDYYQKKSKIFSISGYTLDLNILRSADFDFYLGLRGSSWGWGTWDDRWNDLDWNISDYSYFAQSNKLQREFNRGGSDLCRMLKNQMTGKIDSWAIRWCYNQFRQEKYTVFASKSKVVSIGIGENATHTKKTSRFETILDQSQQTKFRFEDDIKLNFQILRQFKSKFSILSRLLDRIK